MPRPPGWTPYRNTAGQTLPSVTTIIGRFKEAGGLIHWSWKLSNDGLVMARNALQALLADPDSKMARANAKQFLEIPMDTFSYMAVRDKAGDIGTAAHLLVEAKVRGKLVELKEAKEARTVAAYDSFVKWAKQTKLKPEKTEVRLVSETYQFGGMVDAVRLNSGQSLERTIIDWKTSNHVYADYMYQIAAYRRLWNENFPKLPIKTGHLVKFGKDANYPSFTHHHFSEEQLDLAFETFIRMRFLYDHVKAVEKFL